jgi:hypothetical protein
MEPTQFPNVKPAPFMFAKAPASFPSIVGMRSFDQALPAVGGYTDADLERMMFSLRQSGADPAMLGRIQQVMAMRRGSEPPLMLRPTPGKAKRVAAPQPSASYNPFGVINDVLAQPQ